MSYIEVLWEEGRERERDDIYWYRNPLGSGKRQEGVVYVSYNLIKKNVKSVYKGDLSIIL